MTKHNSKDITKKNNKTMSKQNSKTITEPNQKSYSDHLKNNFEPQKRKRNSFSQRHKILKRKRVKIGGITQKNKKNKRKRNLRRNKTANLETNNTNNIASRVNINLEPSLNITRSLSSDDHNTLPLSNLNTENYHLRSYSFNEEYWNFNFNNPFLSNINEIPSLERNDEEILDISVLSRISCNQFDRIERNLFDTLPKIKIEDISSLSNEQCIICLFNYLKDEFITKLSCSHVFHSSCLEEWLSKSITRTCPICRYQI